MADEREMKDVVAVYRNGELEMIAVKDERSQSIVDITGSLRALLQKSESK